MDTPLFCDKVAEIFVKVDDFCNEFENEFKKHSLPAPQGTKTRNRKTTLTDSEVIFISSLFRVGSSEILSIFIAVMSAIILEIVFQI